MLISICIVIDRINAPDTGNGLIVDIIQAIERKRSERIAIVSDIASNRILTIPGTHNMIYIFTISI